MEGVLLRGRYGAEAVLLERAEAQLRLNAVLTQTHLRVKVLQTLLLALQFLVL